MKARQIEVFVNKSSEITISQDEGLEGHEIVSVTHEQIDQLCEWLQLCKKEAIKLYEKRGGE